MNTVVLILLAIAGALAVYALVKKSFELLGVAVLGTILAVALPLLAVLG